MQFEKAIEQYLQWKGTHRLTAPNRYKVRLNHFMSFIGNIPIDSITGNQICEFHEAMEHKMGYSRATVAYSANVLRNFFEFWKGRELVKLNPKEIVNVRFIKKHKEVVSLDDFRQMCLTLDESYRNDLVKKLILHMLWDTGMRVSELCEFTLSDVNNVDVNGLRFAKLRSRKSYEYDLVVWGKETDRLLKLYLGIRLCTDVNTDALFLSYYRKKKSRVTTRTVQRWVMQVANLAMLGKTITPHCFRHGKAHSILDQGGDLRDVQAILRHQNLESALHYVHLNPTKFVKVASKYLTI
jgi:integrase/recombinase XerD